MFHPKNTDVSTPPGLEFLETHLVKAG